MSELKRQIGFLSAGLVCLFSMAACSSNENSHTTATTIVPAPPRQVITITSINLYTKVPSSPCETQSAAKVVDCADVDPKKPLLVFDLPKNSIQGGEVVPIVFAVRNAKLRGHGGDFRIRYFIDDDDARWTDRDEPFGLAGWVPGKHTIRLELIGPDGWPYKNGSHNIITREITVTEP